ncbi:MAG TPA: hypothetical protein VLF93_00815 [Candidatus Saccharimonadales bacterium]|nr:hypothetical protein [Candidatus Saccharimonadales bacterium]
MPLLSMNYVKDFILVCYLLAVAVVILLSWLYHNRTVRVTKAIGLHAPEYIKILVRVSIINAIITACLITFFLLTSISK